MQPFGTTESGLCYDKLRVAKCSRIESLYAAYSGRSFPISVEAFKYPPRAVGNSRTKELKLPLTGYFSNCISWLGPTFPPIPLPFFAGVNNNSTAESGLCSSQGELEGKDKHLHHPQGS